MSDRLEILETLYKMAKRLNCEDIKSCDVITEGAPVIAFGDFSRAKVATLGLNPSDQEFFDSHGEELTGRSRRFHTLKSLGIENWKDLDNDQLKKIMFTCENYFQINPYDRWFKPLNNIISGTGFSYYDSFDCACHLDLVPYATRSKWGGLPLEKRKKLLQLGGKFLLEIINSGDIELIILNGESVVKALKNISNIKLQEHEVPCWNLPRKKSDVVGRSYTSTIYEILGHKVNQPIKLLGFNHNIQSSFGVTNKVKESIKDWITRKYNI
ncbi:hypothetical protein [uncultured Gilvimarinus sp.]|uniref:hypothetical protein n=1 Tax=uncultured Gilvimarinus sp. TaxID=1689143 RepID=UPI0030DDA8B8